MKYRRNPTSDHSTEKPDPLEEAARGSDRQVQRIAIEQAHVNRIAILGQLSTSIADEVNQPVSAVIINAEVALRLLDADPANLEAVRQALTRIVRDGKRAGDVVGRIRALARKAPPGTDVLEINEVVREAIGLTHSEIVMGGVSLRIELAEDLPLVQGDRVQLQQVMLNVIINAIEAMATPGEGPHDLLIKTARIKSGRVLIAVGDSGPGVEPADLAHIYDAFYGTKPDGLGIGLSVCRTIIRAHRGRLWATRGVPSGTVFQFTLPAHG
ncbi:MAG TPA: ATP-binding protein [Candidatus Sulfotelmatobacter sp.]|nr:ATP-binding protein [Candidatus Sulfotelmatobacter sp.]